jgi:hypothetical protein
LFVFCATSKLAQKIPENFPLTFVKEKIKTEKRRNLPNLDKKRQYLYIGFLRKHKTGIGGQHQ